MMAQGASQRGTLIAVAAIIAGGVVAGLLLGRDDTAPAAAPVAEASTPAAVTTPGPASSAPQAAVGVPALGDAELSRLAEESMAGPPALRVAAIEKLSRAPRDQALPLLKRVLLNGDPAVDRPAALRGLRELALAQGDGDQHIRDAVREAIYHGDDESLTSQAQETLDVISEAATK